MSDRVIQFVTVQASRELVWLAWTQEERVAKWFAPQARVEPVAGGAFEVYFDPSNPEENSTKGCRLLAVVPQKELVFEWKGPKELADVMNEEGKLTTVRVTLSDSTVPGGAPGTLVEVEHEGWGEGADWERAQAWHVMAWEQVLSSLKSALESGEGQLCCV